MGKSSGFVLVEVHADGTEVPVSEHVTFPEGWSAGQHAAHADKYAAFSLYVRDGRRVARFCHHRIAIKTTNVEQTIALLV